MNEHICKCINFTCLCVLYLTTITNYIVMLTNFWIHGMYVKMCVCGNVKFNLEQAMKTQREGRGVSLLFL
jgi:hypothetical protein